MTDYVAYHSAELMGHALDANDSLVFFSRKPRKYLESAIGQRVWVIASERLGSEKRYQLTGVYRPSAVTPDQDGWRILGSGTAFHPPIDVTGLPWFRELRREQHDFSFGFNRIKSIDLSTALVQAHIQDATRLSATCIYAIVTRDVLDPVALDQTALTRTEARVWAEAARLFKEASQRERDLPIVLADAKDCSRLLYWGVLVDVVIARDAGTTTYTVDRLRPLRGTYTPQDLVLKSSGEPIAYGYIRSYAICETPGFLVDSPNDPATLAFLSNEEGPSPETLLEGAAIRVVVNAYERNQQARAACLAHHGCACCVCGFDFRAAYGELGADFIHVHHLVPLSTIGEQYRVDPLADLCPVCPNCHAMLHARKPALKPEALRDIMRGQRLTGLSNNQLQLTGPAVGERTGGLRGPSTL